MDPSRIRCAAALCLASCGVLQAFEGGLQFEAGAAGVRDDLLVPLVFSGPQFGVGGMARWEGFGARHEARGRLALAFVSERFGNAGGSMDQELSWLLDWEAAGSPAGPLRLGAGLVSRGRFSYLESWDDAHGYWIGSFAVPATIRQELSMGPWSGWARLAAAVLVLESRPAEDDPPKQHPLADPSFAFGRPFADLEPAWPWEHLDLRLETRMRPPAGRWEFGLSTGFVRADRPRTSFALDAAVVVLRRWGGSP